MGLSNKLAVVRQVGKSIGVTSRDALLPGQALPLNDELVARPGFLNPFFSQYGLGDYRSLPAEVLAANEESLVKYYLSALADNGLELDFDQTWYQYRGFSFQTWMTIIVSMGFGAMTDDMNEVMPEIHRRCIASIERLELGKWLEEVTGQ